MRQAFIVIMQQSSLYKAPAVSCFKQDYVMHLRPMGGAMATHQAAPGHHHCRQAAPGNNVQC